MTTEKVAITPELEARVRQWYADGIPVKRISDSIGISLYHVRKIVDPETIARHNATKNSGEKKPKMVRANRPAVKKPTVEIPSLYILDLHSRKVSITRIAALTRQPYRVVIDVIERAGAAR